MRTLRILVEREMLFMYLLMGFIGWAMLEGEKVRTKPICAEGKSYTVVMAGHVQSIFPASASENNACASK